MKIRKCLLLLLILGASVCIQAEEVKKQEGPKENSAATAVKKAKINQKDEDARYRSTLLFASVLELVRDEYVDPSQVDYDKLTYAALKGMLTSLDPHSQFMDPEAYKDMQMETQGQFGGLGISVGKADGYLTINVPIEGAPAAKAGLLPADRIVKIGDKSTKNMTLSESIKILRGEPGDPVMLTIYRPATKEYKEIKIVRELIDVPTVRDAKIISDASSEKIGYIRLTQFGDQTVEEMEKALKSLQKQGMTCLILDLRNNPGGLLEAAVEVAGKFLPTNTTVVSTEGRLGEADRTLYQSPGRKRILDIPLVILVNGNSASGSEIVAGALQDWRRAVILGETTFGKGSVQTVQPLPNSINGSTALRLTTDHYYTPKRRLIHGTGIVPDIEAPITWEEERDLFLKRSLALLNEEEKARVEKVKDVQLERAVQIIKGLRLFAKKNHLNPVFQTADIKKEKNKS